MNFKYLIILIIFFKFSHSYINIRKCCKKILISNKLLLNKYNLFLENNNNITKSIIESSIDVSSNDIMCEIVNILNYLSDINKELFFVLQQTIRLYIKYLMSESINYSTNDINDNKNNYNNDFIIFLIINSLVKNIIIPTIIHDIFQTFFSIIRNK